MRPTCEKLWYEQKGSPDGKALICACGCSIRHGSSFRTREVLRQEISKAENAYDADNLPDSPMSTFVTNQITQRVRYRRMWVGLLPFFVCLLVIAPSDCGRCQVILPNFGIIGQKGDEVGKLWQRAGDEGILPKQIAIDFSDQGVIYGFVCEYWPSQDVLAQLKGKIQKLTNSEQKSPNQGYSVWRDENRKLAISLFLDDESNTVKLIAVSTDDAIRGTSKTKGTKSKN